MFAPVLAGLLIAANVRWGVPVVALAMIACSLVAVGAARRHLRRAVPSLDAGRGHVGRVLRDAGSAVRLIRDDRDLMFLLRIAVLANLVGAPFYAVLPAYLGEYASSPADLALWFGRAASAYGIGMLVGTLTLVRLRRRIAGGRALLGTAASLAVMCLMLVVAAASSSPYVVVGVMVVNGTLTAVTISLSGAVWLSRTAAEVRVRVFALRRLVGFSSIPVGTVLFGFGGAAVGYRWFAGALAVLVLVALLVVWSRNRADQRKSQVSLEDA